MGHVGCCSPESSATPTQLPSHAIVLSCACLCLRLPPPGLSPCVVLLAGLCRGATGCHSPAARAPTPPGGLLMHPEGPALPARVASPRKNQRQRARTSATVSSAGGVLAASVGSHAHARCATSAATTAGLLKWGVQLHSSLCRSALSEITCKRISADIPAAGVRCLWAPSLSPHGSTSWAPSAAAATAGCLLLRLLQSAALAMAEPAACRAATAPTRSAGHLTAAVPASKATQAPAARSRALSAW